MFQDTNSDYVAENEPEWRDSDGMEIVSAGAKRMVTRMEKPPNLRKSW